MPTDLTSLIIDAVNKARAIVYGTATLKVLTGFQPPFSEIASYPADWFLEHVDPATTDKGANFYKLFVIDEDGTRSGNLARATHFALLTYVYKKLPDHDRPEGIIPLWHISLQITGLRI